MIARLKFSIHELSSRPKSWNSDSFQDSLRRAFYFLHRTTFIRTSPPTNPFHNILQFQTARPKNTSFRSPQTINADKVVGEFGGYMLDIIQCQTLKTEKLNFYELFFATSFWHHCLTPRLRS